ncbi:MAG: Hsp20/alpha crystallin family protein [Myxococcota bacterium]
MRNLLRLVEQDPILRDIVNPSLPTARWQARFEPAVDVVETPEGWTLILEVPGVPRDALSLKLDGTRLSVRGTKPERVGKARVAERETGPFLREFILPFQVRAEAITAHLADGVLTVTLPRSGAGGAQQIPVT